MSAGPPPPPQYPPGGGPPQYPPGGPPQYPGGPPQYPPGGPPQYPGGPPSYPPGGTGGWYGPPPDQRQATTALVLGILSIVVCSLIGPFAWSVGRSSLREIDASGGALGGRSKAQAGMIMGIIGTVLIVVSVFAFATLFSFSTSSGY